jgi:hypothetical protein
MRIEDHQFKSSPIDSPSGETNDCTVITFAYAFNTTYEKAHEFMAFVGRKPRKGVSMYRALNSHKEKIEQEFGYTVEEIEFRWNEQYRRQPTLGKLVNELDKGMYVVIVSGHMFPIHNNEVVDTFRPRKLVRAKRIFKVTKV